MQIGSIAVAFSSVVDRLGPIVAENAARADESSRISAVKKVSRQPADELQLSDASEQAAAALETELESKRGATSEIEASTSPEKPAQKPSEKPSAAGQLSKEEQQQVRELKKRDTKVRAHEQAHLSAAGPYASGGASFEYQTGPDGGRYAIGGEVQIDTSAVPDDPGATIAKAQIIRAAASAPAEPSGQDRAVAAGASRMEAQARKELAQQQQQTRSGEADPQATSPAQATSAGKSSGERPPENGSQIAARAIAAYAGLATRGQAARSQFNAVA